MTVHVCRALIVCLWAFPLVGILLTFTLPVGQGFTSPGCTGHAFLLRLPFRATFSALIIAPTIAIVLIYCKFHSLLWQRDVVVSNSISRQNVRYVCSDTKYSYKPYLTRSD